MIPYVMSWQDYTLTMAEILAWPATVVASVTMVAAMVTGAIREYWRGRNRPS